MLDQSIIELIYEYGLFLTYGKLAVIGLSGLAKRKYYDINRLISHILKDLNLEAT